MDALWNRGIQAFANAVDKDNKKLHKRKTYKKDKVEKYAFSPQLADEKQLEIFQRKYSNGSWDGRLSFKGYKGTFKIEYWIYLESKLREIDNLKFVSFVDTILSKDHLSLLGKWLQWLAPETLDIVFKHNELDDEKVEEFIYQLFKRNIKINKIAIISNPGIFKGNFLSQLKSFLAKQYQHNQEFYYNLIKNKTKMSIAILKIQRNQPDQEIQEQIQKTEYQIDQTYFYKLGLNSCFTESNTEAFEELISICYHEDNLEQLQSLDVANCNLGNYAVFYQICKKMSTARGLLYLSLENQPHIHNANIAKTLMGDRYNQLRTNKINLSNNQKMIEKSFQQFTDNVISSSCKSFQTSKSLDQHLPVIVKMYYMGESFKNRVSILKQKSIKKKQIFKSTLKVLDMSETENYNRHDLVRGLIDNTVCNEFSNIKTLFISNCDIGRLNSYTDSFVHFKQYISEKIKKDPLFKNFKCPLHEIIIPSQKYRMEVEPMRRFFNEVVFPTQDCFLEIYHVKLRLCFKQNNREEGYLRALEQIQESIDKNPNIRYHLKTLEFVDTYVAHFGLKQFKLFLATPNIQLESLIILTEELEKFNFDELYESINLYTSTLQQNQFHTLKILKLDDILEIEIELQAFIKAFLFHKKMRIEEFSISLIKTKNTDQEEWNDIQNIIDSWDKSEKLALKKLSFGNFDKSGGGKQIFKHLVISKVTQLEQLTLKKYNLQDFIESFKTYYQLLRQQEIDPLNKLHNLTLDKITIEGKEAWYDFSSLFIFNHSVPLESLQIIEGTFTQEMFQGLEQSIVQVIENNSEGQAPFTLKSLSYTSCDIQNCDVLTVFLANPLCKLQNLEIIKCKNFQESLTIFKEFHDANSKLLLYTFALKSVIIEGGSFTDELFDGFVNRIIFHQERQLMEKLHLIDCKLTSSQIDILAKAIKRVKLYEKDEQLKRYFQLRDVSFNQNNGISSESWIQLFKYLQDQDMVNEEKQENHEQKEQAKLDINQIDVNRNLNEDEDKLNELIENTQQLINKNQLNLFQKIIQAPQVYAFKPPKQLIELEIDMKFEKINEDFKKLMYFQILQGLIIFPENQLKKLKLTNLDLDIFVDEMKKAISSIKTYYQTFLLKPIPIVQLEEIDFSKMTKQSEESINEILRIFLCSEKIDLVKLTFTDVNQKLISSIRTFSPLKQKFKLIYLDIQRIQETLDADLTTFFIKSVLLGQLLPLKEIKIGKDLQIQKPELAEIISDLEYGKLQVPLEKLHLEIAHDMQYEVYQVLLSALVGSKYQKLRKLVIKEEQAKFQALDQLMSNLPNHQIKLQKLELNNLILSVKFVKFFKLIRPTLKSFIVKTINMDKDTLDETKEAIESFILKSEDILDCKIEFQQVETEKEFIYSQFIFNERFRFTSIKMQKFTNEIAFGNKFTKIKYLNLSFALVFNSQQQWEPKNYELIGNNFLYNRESQLEQLVLHQCHMKIDGIKALVKGADQFRKDVENDKLQQKLKMKLNRINIYYSLYFQDEGFEIFHKNVTYFEYFDIERFEFQVTNYNDNHALSLCKSAKEWLRFQKLHKRTYTTYFPLQYLDLGRNEFVQSQEAWNELCDTFLFTDKTPLMTTLNIHFMSMTDPIIDMISAKSNRYFDSKSKNYVYSVKKLNYSLNTALTWRGWKRISEELFFHPKVELEELNLNSTMLDEANKIYAIRDAVIKKAMTKPNQKLKLHTLLCFNLWLKDSIVKYLAPHPKNYKPPFDIPVKIDYDSWRPGWATGMPESFGDFQQQIQSAIYQREQFINQGEWKIADDFRISQLHQEFISSFIIPINEYYRSKGLRQLTLSLDTTTMDSLCNLYKYPQIEPGKPYPYNLLFQEDFYKYQRQSTCIITTINIIQTKINKLEEINQMDIYRLWKNLKSKKTTIDQVIIDYELNDDLIELMYAEGYTENELIQLIRLFPPSKIRAENSITIQAIKGIYSIFWDAHNFEYSTLSYDFDNFLNIGIGYALREIVYNSKNVGWTRYFKKFTYALLDIFVRDVSKYELDYQVHELNEYLSKQKLFYYLIGFNNLLFYLVCILPPIYFTLYFDGKPNQETQDQYCQEGITDYANYSYYAFAFLSFIIEAWLFKKTSILLSNHIEYLIDLKVEDELDEEEIQTNKIVPIDDAAQEELNQEQPYQAPPVKTQKTFTQQLNELARSEAGQWANYFLKIGLAQLEKLDLYNDVAFTLTCYFCNEMILFYITLSVTAFNTTYYFLKFIGLLYTRITETEKTSKMLSTKYINDFFSIAVAGRHEALAEILDSVAPFNVSIIPNNFLTRFFFPNQAGRSINNAVKGYLFKFTLEDVPQILVQMYFVVVQAIKNGGDLSWSIYVTVIISVLSLILSFVRFMSIRPSSITQAEFDELSEQKAKQRMIKKKELIEQEQQLLTDYSKLNCEISDALSDNENNNNEMDQLL